MNWDTPMNANEIVNLLRVRAETQNKRGYSGEASELIEIADLIESQAAEIARLNGLLQEWCSGEDQYQETVSQLDCAKGRIAELKEILAASQRRERAAVEDLGIIKDCQVCQRDDDGTCGDYEGCNFLWRGQQEADHAE